MKSRSVKLLVLRGFLYIASILCFFIGKGQPSNYEKFGLSDCFTELNKWDYFGGGLLVFAIAATIAFSSVKRLED